jgi:glutathione S-transferase
LIDGEAQIFDSTIILEYLEDKFPSPPLLPRAEGVQAEKMKETAARQTAELQAWLTDKLGEALWFNGESFGWADLSVAPFVNRSFHYGFATPAGSPLAQWRERIRARPSVAETFREFEAAAERMGDAAQRLASGAIRREYRDHRLEWMMKSGGVRVVLDGLAKDNIRFTWPLG